MSIWHIGGAFTYPEELLQFCQTHNSQFVVYDSIPMLAWNGGRIPANSVSIQDLPPILQQYAQTGISVDISFSNTADINFNDSDCNEVLTQLAQYPDNGVIVANQALAQYIRKQFPNLRLTASLCFCNSTVKFLCEACQFYDSVAINPDLNRRPDLLIQLDPNKIQLLVNENCYAGCQQRKAHYQLLSQHVQDPTYVDGCICTEYTGDRGSLYLTKDEVQNLQNFGIQHFKIQGRQDKGFMTSVGACLQKLEVP